MVGNERGNDSFLVSFHLFIFWLDCMEFQAECEVLLQLVAMGDLELSFRVSEEFSYHGRSMLCNLSLQVGEEKLFLVNQIFFRGVELCRWFNWILFQINDIVIEVPLADLLMEFVDLVGRHIRQIFCN